MIDLIITAISVLLIPIAFVNWIFLRDSLHKYQAVHPRSPLLLALLAVAIVIWLMGAYFAVVAARVLTDAPGGALPFGGIGLGLIILLVSGLPGFIWLQLRKFVDGEGDEK